MCKGKSKIKKILTMALSASLVMGMVENAGTEVQAGENTVAYVPGIVYDMNEEELAAKGEAPEGYEWDVIEVSPHADGYYDMSATICGQEEHTHSAATEADCQGYELTCTETEHVHTGVTGNCYSQTCTQPVHEHSLFRCGYFMGWLCGMEEHKHTEDCYTLTCAMEEHTHTAYGGNCYTQKICDIPEHVHSVEKGCYRYEEPVQAMYKCQLIAAGSTGAQNGNEAITINVKVICADGTPANGVVVTLVAKDWDPLAVAETPELTKTATTGLKGSVSFSISGTYDRIMSVTVQNALGESYNVISVPQGIGYLENEKNYTYQFSEHSYILDADTVVAAELTKDGYTGDSVCAHCMDVKTGTIVPKTGVNVTYTGIKGAADVVVPVEKGSVFAGITVPGVAHTHATVNGKYVVNNVNFTGWLLNQAAVPADYIVEEDIEVTASYSTDTTADTDVQFYMLKEGVTKPEGVTPSADANFTYMGNGEISENATVTADSKLLAGYFDATAVSNMLSGYTKSIYVGGTEVVYEHAEIFRTMYITGSGKTAGWHADCRILDVNGNAVQAGEWSYVFFCDENGQLLTDAQGNKAVRCVATGTLLTDVYSAPEKAEDDTCTYSFTAWRNGGENFDFTNTVISTETLVVCAGYTATEKVPQAPEETPAPDAPPAPEVTPAPEETPAPETTPAPTPAGGNTTTVIIEDEDTPLADAAVLGAGRGNRPADDGAAVLGADRKPGTGDDSGIWTAGFWVSLTCLAGWLYCTRKK